MILGHPGWAEPAAFPLGEQVHALKKSIVAYRKALFMLRENPVKPAPHIEIFFDVDSRSDPIPAHHLPSWIRLALDHHPPAEHTYTDGEWHTLAAGALQTLLTVSAGPGQHTLAVSFKGIDRNGKSYLKAKTLTFESTRAADHRVLRFRAGFNEEPHVTLEPAGESLLDVRRADRPIDDPVYRLGLFAAQTGDFGNAAVFFLSALDREPPPRLKQESRLRLAEAYAAVGLPEEADAVLHTLISEAPDDEVRARAWFLIEQIAFRDGQHARVIEAHNHLGAALPAELAGEAHALAGISALALRAYPEAAGFFRSVPKSSPDEPLALYGQAQALSGLGDAFTASTTLKRLIQSHSIFDPIRSRVVEHAHAALGLQLIEQGRYDEALAELGQVGTNSAVHETALFGVAWALRKADEHVKAIAILQELLARFPNGQHAHEARLTLAASYADLRAYTRSVTAHRAALDGLTAAMDAVDRLRAAIKSSQWDPLNGEAGNALEDAAFSRALEHYRWLVRFERDLRQTLEHLPSDITAAPPPSVTLGVRLQSLDSTQLAAKGQELLVKFDAVKFESRGVLAALALDALAREQAQLEDWAVQASLGIARNLVAERDELGSEALTLE
ncbi:MAG: tetratricopeptide repeat protein [Nitrospirae bacterium]|nr:tetratricopeptide repeat protein [Nitrospirota bacterium]